MYVSARETARSTGATLAAAVDGGENNSIAAFSLESLQAFPVSVSLHWAVASHTHIYTADYMCVCVCMTVYCCA